MGTVHWTGIQIQCFMQIRCFKKNILSDTKYMLKNA